MLKTMVTAGFASTLFFLSASGQAQTKWDMPTPYPASNFHTENIRQFADECPKTVFRVEQMHHGYASCFRAEKCSA